jgi:hypothetical protein
MGCTRNSISATQATSTSLKFSLVNHLYIQNLSEIFVVTIFKKFSSFYLPPELVTFSILPSPNIEIFVLNSLYPYFRSSIDFSPDVYLVFVVSNIKSIKSIPNFIYLHTQYITPMNKSTNTAPIRRLSARLMQKKQPAYLDSPILIMTSQEIDSSQDNQNAGKGTNQTATSLEQPTNHDQNHDIASVSLTNTINTRHRRAIGQNQLEEAFVLDTASDCDNEIDNSKQSTLNKNGNKKKPGAKKLVPKPTLKLSQSTQNTPNSLEPSDKYSPNDSKSGSSVSNPVKRSNTQIEISLIDDDDDDDNNARIHPNNPLISNDQPSTQFQLRNAFTALGKKENNNAHSKIKKSKDLSYLDDTLENEELFYLIGPKNAAQNADINSGTDKNPHQTSRNPTHPFTNLTTPADTNLFEGEAVGCIDVDYQYALLLQQEEDILSKRGPISQNSQSELWGDDWSDFDNINDGNSKVNSVMNLKGGTKQAQILKSNAKLPFLKQLSKKSQKRSKPAAMMIETGPTRISGNLLDELNRYDERIKKKRDGYCLDDDIEITFQKKPKKLTRKVPSEEIIVDGVEYIYDNDGELLTVKKKSNIASDSTNNPVEKPQLTLDQQLKQWSSYTGKCSSDIMDNLDHPKGFVIPLKLTHIKAKVEPVREIRPEEEYTIPVGYEWAKLSPTTVVDWNDEDEYDWDDGETKFQAKSLPTIRGLDLVSSLGKLVNLEQSENGSKHGSTHTPRGSNEQTGPISNQDKFISIDDCDSVVNPIIDSDDDYDNPFLSSQTQSQYSQAHAIPNNPSQATIGKNNETKPIGDDDDDDDNDLEVIVSVKKLHLDPLVNLPHPRSLCLQLQQKNYLQGEVYPLWAWCDNCYCWICDSPVRNCGDWGDHYLKQLKSDQLRKNFRQLEFFLFNRKLLPSQADSRQNDSHFDETKSNPLHVISPDEYPRTKEDNEHIIRATKNPPPGFFAKGENKTGQKSIFACFAQAGRR